MNYAIYTYNKINIITFNYFSETTNMFQKPNFYFAINIISIIHILCFFVFLYFGNLGFGGFLYWTNWTNAIERSAATWRWHGAERRHFVDWFD